MGKNDLISPSLARKSREHSSRTSLTSLGDRELLFAAGGLIVVGLLVPLWHGVLAGALILVYLDRPLPALLSAFILDLIVGPAYGLWGIPLFFTLTILVALILWTILKRYLRTHSHL